MPKISKRRNVGQYTDHVTHRRNSMTARKVSFEDSETTSSSSSCSFEFEAPAAKHHAPTLVRKSRTDEPYKSKGLLRRPTPSVCLSDLAAQEDERALPMLLLPTRRNGEESCSSPWGQFVDVIPQDEEYSMYKVQSFPVLLSSKNSCEPYRLERRPLRQSDLEPTTWEVESALERMHVWLRLNMNFTGTTSDYNCEARHKQQLTMNKWRCIETYARHEIETAHSNIYYVLIDDYTYSFCNLVQ